MKVALAVASTLVIALMMAMPASASGGGQSKSTYVVDREGDLGKSWYPVGNQGSHLAGDPISWWSGDSPMSKAGYLDILAGWVTVEGQQITMGVQVKDPVTVGTQLPDGVKQVRWAWWFFLDNAHFHSDYLAIIAWDGIEFTAALKDLRAHTEPYPVTYLSSDSITIEGNLLTLTVDSSALQGANWWFFESHVFKNLWPLEEQARYGGWFAADRTDRPTDTMLPWWPMP